MPATSLARWARWKAAASWGESVGGDAGGEGLLLDEVEVGDGEGVGAEVCSARTGLCRVAGIWRVSRGGHGEAGGEAGRGVRGGRVCGGGLWYSRRDADMGRGREIALERQRVGMAGADEDESAQGDMNTRGERDERETK